MYRRRQAVKGNFSLVRLSNDFVKYVDCEKNAGYKIMYRRRQAVKGNFSLVRLSNDFVKYVDCEKMPDTKSCIEGDKQ